MNKNILLTISGVISVVLLYADWIGTYKICGAYSTGDCPFILHNITITLFVFIPVFILSLITYKLKDETFRVWLKFSYFWVPLTIILTLLAPEYDESLLPLTKGLVSLSLSTLFLLISLIIIIKKSLFSKK